MSSVSGPCGNLTKIPTSKCPPLHPLHVNAHSCANKEQHLYAITFLALLSLALSHPHEVIGIAQPMTLPPCSPSPHTTCGAWSRREMTTARWLQGQLAAHLLKPALSQGSCRSRLTGCKRGTPVCRSIPRTPAGHRLPSTTTYRTTSTSRPGDSQL